MRVGTGLQLLVVAAVVGAACWTAYATGALVAAKLETSRIAQDAEALESGQRAVIERLAAENATLSAQLDLERETATRLASHLATARLAGADARSARKAAQAEAAALEARLSELDGERTRIRTDLTEAEGRLAEIVAQSAPAAVAPTGVAAGVTQFAETAGAVIAERDEAEAEVTRLNEALASVSTQLAVSEARRERMIARLESATESGLIELRQIFDRAGLDRAEIVAGLRPEYSGRGGPFEPVEDGGDLGSGEAETRVAALMKDLEEASLLRIAVERLPFARPVTNARFTSGFGKRRDPLRRRWSMHKGVDWAAARGTPIAATASGVVTFSGRMRGYGKVVRIRHAFGFETLYAHLNRMRVKVGQRVDRGDRIGDMGSTGRSTGVHLHYEIRIDGKPINPLNFIEAARDVL